MSNIDRSKFKATTRAAAQKTDKVVRNVIGGKGERADRLKIEPGKNYFRIFPFHPDGGGETYYEPLATYYLPIEQEVEKDGKKRVEMRTKPVFHARIHHSKLKKDVVEEYKKFCEKVAKENFSSEAERERYLKPLKYDRVTRKGGLDPVEEYAIYAKKINVVDGSSVFGLLSYKTAVKIGLNKIAASESDDEPLGTDPFTDLEDGRTVTVTYDDKATRPQDYYDVQLYVKTNEKRQLILHPITDAELEKFMQVPSLHKLFRDVYSKYHFNLAVKGLKNFDSEFKMGVFNYEEWTDILEQLESEIPDDNSAPGETKPVSSKTLSSDEFDEMDRSELKGYNRDNNCGVIVTTKMSDDEIREQLRDWKETQGEVEDEKEEVEEEEVDDPPFEVSKEKNLGITPKGASTAKSKLKELKDKARKK